MRAIYLDNRATAQKAADKIAEAADHGAWLAAGAVGLVRPYHAIENLRGLG
jgi:hypothetical protein